MRTRKQVMTILSMTAVGASGVGLATAAVEADRTSVTARATETVDGRITKVDFDAMTFEMVVKPAPDGQETKHVTIAWNEKTECLLDGKSVAAKEALKPGLATTVTHEEMIAIRVDSKSPQPE